ncbi:hypothetical protein HAX54_045702, partial [Datura stramonium]|nr:hypothetical protein [Datura stramonium]
IEVYSLWVCSFALGKRFAVAKLTASLSARAKLRPRLLVASGRLIPSPEIQVSTGKDLLIHSLIGFC